MTRQSLPDAADPDPGRINSQQDFGRELTLARQQAGLTIRDVAKASGIPVSTVGDYFAARHLPPARQPELLPSILAACQITEPGQVARWLDALNRVRTLAGHPAPLAWPGTEGPLGTGLLAQGLREDPERHARLALRGDEPPAIIVDQLEEIFTADAGEGERGEFVAALPALSQDTL